MKIKFKDQEFMLTINGRTEMDFSGNISIISSQKNIIKFL